MKACIYCGKNKKEEQFSDEHIWPAALGGDFLPEFWRTNDVCTSCNNMSGVFVDGAFIKSFFGTVERSHESQLYLSPENPRGILPLSYLGVVTDSQTSKGEMVDFWVCTPGANIVHIRREFEQDTWDIYAGGDPRAFCI